MAANTAVGAEKKDTRTITFKNKEHKDFYKEYLQKCRYQDVYHKALVYCLGIDRDTRVNVDRIYEVDGLVIDDMQRKVTVDGRNVRLTPIEYKILRLLVRQKGKVFSNSQIYENIWNMQAIGADNTIAVHIRHIREKIEKNPKEPRYLKVVWGNGYKVG